jgi:aryl-alcohol dehydrogenase-like predicted oxidoreductase
MEYRQLGSSGLRVSAIGLGTNNFGRRMDADQSARVLHQALDMGINLVDTANMYGDGQSEEYIGRALKGRRSETIVATKVSNSVGDGPNQRGASRQHIINQVEISLKRLQTDYIDLYQIHFPDPSTPIEETLRALDNLVRDGKVQYIGCSNFSAWQVCEAIWTSQMIGCAPFVSIQPEYSLLKRDIEQELLPFCLAYQIGILPYFPLASGLLTGKYSHGEAAPDGTRFRCSPELGNQFMTERNFLHTELLKSFAEEHGHTLTELAFAWLLANPAVSSVIAGATSPEQIVENAQCIQWKLTPNDIEEVNKCLTNLD